MKHIKSTLVLISIFFLLFGCKGGKLPGSDARKVPYDPRERVKRNLEQGKGFRLNNAIMGKRTGGDFEFASSNELWRASLDVIDFMPLSSANYSGGVIITDWYSDNNNPNESLKITIRFLTNEIRSDALNIKIFYKNCENLNQCIISEKSGTLSKELKKEILKLATQYKQNSDKENFEPYIVSDPKD
tara:strand:- start:315 stop:875 length:561 start_codon:yes stop_codon:yes gene_type:complete